MIQVIENSTNRLQLRLGGWGISTGLCTLDRENNVAEFARLALRVPYARKRVALTDVRSVMVKRRGRRKTYHPVVELRLERAISMGGYTKADALEAAKVIKDFLGTQR